MLFHVSIDADDPRHVAAREGWRAKHRRRGDLFGVVELWPEGYRMIEVLTPPMQAKHREAMASQHAAMH